MKYIRYRNMYIAIGYESVGFGAVILLSNKECEITTLHAKNYSNLLDSCKKYIDSYQREIKGGR